MVKQTLLFLLIVGCAACDDTCSLGCFSSGTSGIAAIKYAEDQAGLYAADDSGPIGVLAQSAQQAAACVNELEKYSRLPEKKYPGQNEPLPTYFGNILRGIKTDMPNSDFLGSAVEAHVGSEKVHLMTKGMASLCFKQHTYPNGETVCSHRTLMLCSNIASSIVNAKGNLTARNIFTAGARCLPVYQEVHTKYGYKWFNVMSYDLPQSSLRYTNTAVLPSIFSSSNLVGLDTDILSLGDPQALSNVSACTTNLTIRHQLEANLGFPATRFSPFSGVQLESEPSQNEITYQTQAAGCSHAGVPPSRQTQCDDIIGFVNSTASSVLRTGRICADYSSGISDVFLSAAATLSAINTGGITTGAGLERDIASAIGEGAIMYPPTSTAELLLSILSCILAIALSKKADVGKVSLNISRVAHVQSKQKVVSFIIYLLIATAAASSAISIMVVNIAGSHYVPIRSFGNFQSIDAPDNKSAPKIEVTLLFQLAYYYKPTNYKLSIGVSAAIIIISALWAVYRCVTLIIPTRPAPSFRATSYP